MKAWSSDTFFKPVSGRVEQYSSRTCPPSSSIACPEIQQNVKSSLFDDELVCLDVETQNNKQHMLACGEARHRNCQTGSGTTTTVTLHNKETVQRNIISRSCVFDPEMRQKLALAIAIASSSLCEISTCSTPQVAFTIMACSKLTIIKEIENPSQRPMRKNVRRLINADSVQMQHVNVVVLQIK